MIQATPRERVNVKIIDIISSCKTRDQCMVARKYILLWNDQNKDPTLSQVFVSLLIDKYISLPFTQIEEPIHVDFN